MTNLFNWPRAPNQFSCHMNLWTIRSHNLAPECVSYIYRILWLPWELGQSQNSHKVIVPIANMYCISWLPSCGLPSKLAEAAHSTRRCWPSLSLLSCLQCNPKSNMEIAGLPPSLPPLTYPAARVPSIRQSRSIRDSWDENGTGTGLADAAAPEGDRERERERAGKWDIHFCSSERAQEAADMEQRPMAAKNQGPAGRSRSMHSY